MLDTIRSPLIFVTQLYVVSILLSLLVHGCGCLGCGQTLEMDGLVLQHDMMLR